MNLRLMRGVLCDVVVGGSLLSVDWLARLNELAHTATAIVACVYFSARAFHLIAGHNRDSRPEDNHPDRKP